MCGLQADRLPALGVLRRLEAKPKLSAVKRQETHLSGNNQKEKCIDDYVDRETALAKKRVQDTEIPIMEVQEDLRYAQMAGSTTRKPKQSFREVLNTIGDNLSDFAHLDNENDVEDNADNGDDPDLGKLTEYDEPGSGMGTISKTVSNSCGIFGRSR